MLISLFSQKSTSHRHVVPIRSRIMISIITIIIIISNNTIIIMTNLILKVTVMLSPSAPELRRRGMKPILTNTLIWAIVMMAMTIMMVMNRIRKQMLFEVESAEKVILCLLALKRSHFWGVRVVLIMYSGTEPAPCVCIWRWGLIFHKRNRK